MSPLPPHTHPPTAAAPAPPHPSSRGLAAAPSGAQRGGALPPAVPSPAGAAEAAERRAAHTARAAHTRREPRRQHLPRCRTPWRAEGTAPGTVARRRKARPPAQSRVPPRSRAGAPGVPVPAMLRLGPFAAARCLPAGPRLGPLGLAGNCGSFARSWLPAGDRGALSRQVRAAAGGERLPVLKTPKVKAGAGVAPVGTGCFPAPLPLMAALYPGQGTRDHAPAQAALRERLVSAVVSCFKRHGAAAIDTPVLELRVRRAGSSLGPSCGERTCPGAVGPLCSIPWDRGAPLPPGFPPCGARPGREGCWTFTLGAF